MSKIQIKTLVLVGYRKDYTVDFNPGVNIIYGDSTTGKSSILELINYAFGSKKFELYHEIESSVKYMALELKLNDKDYVIKRDIFNPLKLVEVFASDYENIKKVFPEKYAPSFKVEAGPSGYLSDFFFEALSLPNVKVRQAPTQSTSKMIRLSFRDIFKYCYLNQEEVGSTKLLDVNNWPVYNKNKQTFKYFFNLLDSSITILESQISELEAERKELKQDYSSINRFLINTKFDSIDNLNETYIEFEEEIEILENKLSEIRNKVTHDSEEYNLLKDILYKINLSIQELEDDKLKSEHSIEKYSRLKNDYLNDIDKLKAIKLSQNVIGEESVKTATCPICDSNISIEKISEKFTISPTENINKEINTLKRRASDLIDLIVLEKDKNKKLNFELEEFNKEADKARTLLDKESKNMISPYLSERDGILSQLATIKERKNQINQIIKVRNEENKIASKIVSLENTITALEKSLKELREKAPSIDTILSDIQNNLKDFLTTVNIKDKNFTTISKKDFLPIIKDKKYDEVTSGGLRTILSIGYFSSLLKYSIFNKINLPSFLMVDTVGKYLGKTKKEYLVDTDKSADISENISDPIKYQNIYEGLINISDESNEACQIILVDNDVPKEIQENYSGFIIKKFSSIKEEGSTIGLIDDIEY
ncbi:MAG: AAA family ATPase [Arcobacter sp.]|uniref:AAA family ATPase n=1 Tax=Arcobacter sp. TaxID=1872629 RepID=UPI003C720090